MIRIVPFLGFLLCSIALFAQKEAPYKFGYISQADYDLNIYEKDSTANAVFLYEYGKSTFHEATSRIVIYTTYYGKVKIFNKEGVEHATVTIPIYKNKQSQEKVIEIRAITHNGFVKTSLDKKDIFTEKINDNWSEVKFTMPNIKDNSIIEYEYTLVSPFKFNFKGWNFQDDIPKIYSEFYALIPGNYRYNRRLIGYQKLVTNTYNLKKSCFAVSGVVGEADCEELTYAMQDIPAFVKEDYMTAKENYLAAIRFELSQFNGFDGVQYKYTKSWKDVDKEFRKEKSIGKQLKKVDYIKKQLPLDLIEGENNLQKAKKIYHYIKSHFTWNNKSRVFDEVNIKDAFDKKIGNATEINISLINALSAAGFDTEIMLLSTRKNGLPTKVHPIMTDFNYAIAKLNIGNNNYLLDATNKKMPFGMLPFKTLNGYGRVMNFKKGSYWHTITSKENNRTRTSLKLKIDENGNFKGQMHRVYDGYRAINKRIDINNLDEDAYIAKTEQDYGNDDKLIINSYKNSNLTSIEEPLKELFDITIENDLSGTLVIFNPFIDGNNTENPFKLNKRTYPVDFGYSRFTSFNLQLEIPSNYTVKSLPKKVILKLPNKGGSCIFDANQINNTINIIFRTSLNRSYFLPEEYPYLKEFYNQIIKTQKSLITLEKN